MHDEHNIVPTSLAIFEDASEERAFLFPCGLETSMESCSGETGKHHSECVLGCVVHRSFPKHIPQRV